MSVNSLRLVQKLRSLDANCEILSLNDKKLISLNVLSVNLIYSLIPQNWEVIEHNCQDTTRSTRTFSIRVCCPDFEILTFFIPDELE